MGTIYEDYQNARAALDRQEERFGGEHNIARTVLEEDIPRRTARLLAEVAQLDQIEYGRRRKGAARELGIGVATLDAQVQELRPKSEKSELGRAAIKFDVTEAWPDPVDGAHLLDEIAATFNRFIILPPWAAVALGLWVIHTYVFDAAEASPIVAVTSPEMRCGKTMVLEVLEPLVHRPLPASNITSAALFRIVEASKPTLLIDEADTFLTDDEELRGVLNSGHRRTAATIIRTTGENHEPRQYSTWCPKAIAKIGALPPTIEDRSIVIGMRRKSPEEKTERMRHHLLWAEFEPLRRKAVRWGSDNLGFLSESDPAVPDAIGDRAADCWRPLIAIADAVGGDWITRSRQAAVALSKREGNSSASSQLLFDIREIFKWLKADKLSSESIVEELVKMEDRPWPEWKTGKPLSKPQLSRLLKPFSIVSKTIRIPSGTIKGYELKQFADAFSRYLDSLDVTTSQATPAEGSEEFH